MKFMKSNFKYLFVFLFLFISMSFVSAYNIRVNFYDENSLSAISTVTITDSNGSTYTSDVNGLWTASLTGAKSFDISKTGYATRPLDFNFIADANYNFLLNPTSLDANIDFLVRDSNNNLWTSKYLVFKNTSDKIGFNEQVINSSLPVINVNTGAYAYILQLTFDYNLLNKYITYTTNEIKGGSSTGCAIKYQFIYSDNTDSNVSNETTGTTYVLKTYTNPNPTKPVKKINVWIAEVTGGSELAYMQNNIVYGNGNYFPGTKIINSILTSSTGTATGSLAPAGDYNASLYNTNGALNNTYLKTTVTVYKPKNEKTLADISPYDIYVGGLLSYSVTNQTSASQTVNIFGGTTSTYDFSVVDYNATPSYRIYVPRTYQVNNPWGSSYSTTYYIQPYLVAIVDAIIPQIVTIDIIKRPVPNVLVEVYKSISGITTLVERKYTDSTGVVSYSAYPLDTYIFKLYHNSILQGTYNKSPTSDNDTMYIVLDLFSDESVEYSPDLLVNWNMQPSYNVSTTDVTAIATVTINSVDTDYNISGYTVSADQNGTILSSSSASNSGGTLSVSHAFAKALFDANINYATIYLDVNYTYNGTNYTTRFRNIVGISRNNTNLFTIMQSVLNDLGHLWTMILAIFVTIVLLAFITTQVGVDELAISVIGMLIIGFFVVVGWVAIGIEVLGVDIMVYTYILSCAAVLYFMVSRR